MSIHRTDGTGTPPRPDQLREAQQQKATRQAGRTAQKGDTIEISEGAREAERLRVLAAEIPEVRQKEVREASTDQLRVDSRRLARLLTDADDV